jgi:hypothetical protein
MEKLQAVRQETRNDSFISLQKIFDFDLKFLDFRKNFSYTISRVKETLNLD